MKRNQSVMYAGRNLHHLSITYVANGVAKTRFGNRRKYRITLTTDYGKATFQYYDSIKNYENGKKGLTLDDLNNALDCFIDDCYAHINNEYGFGGRMSNREMSLIKRDCKKKYERLMTIAGGNDERRKNFVNAINKVVFDR